EGVCRVEGDDDKGIFVSYIDRSPEALKRQEAVRRRERQDKGDEEREQKALRQQAERAYADRVEAGKAVGDPDPAAGLLVRQNEGEKVKLSLGPKVASESNSEPATTTSKAEDQSQAKESQAKDEQADKPDAQAEEPSEEPVPSS